MRGYPKGLLCKQDYINLLAIPEFADQAQADLAELAAQDDSMITVDRGTEDAPDLVNIENPLPAWKRAGFDSRDDLEKLAGIAEKDDTVEEKFNDFVKGA